MARLFAALRPLPAMRAQLRQAMHGLTGARWQSDEQLHLTLRFIGEADRHRQADIVAALGSIGGPAPVLGIAGVGMFDSKGRPNSIWAAVQASAELNRIVKSIDRALVGVGLTPETRAFRPHITLARLGRSAAAPDPWLEANAGLRVAPELFGHLYLYESVLAREGSTYIVIDRHPLI